MGRVFLNRSLNSVSNKTVKPTLYRRNNKTHNNMTQKEKPKLLYEGKDAPKQFMRVYEWHGRKFRIRCEHTNGTSLGVNSHCCLAVMSMDGDWKRIEDNHSLGIRWYNCCVYNADDPRIDKVNKEAEKAFLEYIKSVY